MNHRTFKYRLLPNKRQYTALTHILESQRQLYNAALQERMECFQKTGKGRTYVDQCRAITELRKEAEYANVPVKLQRWTIKRLDHAYKAFFKRGGYPRFRSAGLWKSFGFTEFSGFDFDGKRLRFKGLPGGLRVHLHRQMEGEIKSCVFTKDIKGWYVSFQVAIPANENTHTGAFIGLDVGLKSFGTLSNGEAIPAPQIARKAHRELRRRQRALSRCRRGSNRRKKVRTQLERSHAKIANTRRTFLHQQSARLARDYSLIAVEDLKIRNMVKNPHLVRSISDAGWGTFIEMLTYKAESAGGKVIKVNPRNTSQSCSGCGQIVPKDLSVRIHSCDCGTVLDRDHNAALNILALAVLSQDQANVAKCRKRPDGNTAKRRGTALTRREQ